MQKAGDLGTRLLGVHVPLAACRLYIIYKRVLITGADLELSKGGGSFLLLLVSHTLNHTHFHSCFLKKRVFRTEKSPLDLHLP